jgi:hypothetical protein
MASAGLTRTRTPHAHRRRQAGLAAGESSWSGLAARVGVPVVSPAVQLAAPLVLSNKGPRALSTSGMGRGDYDSVDAPGYCRLDTI